MKHIRNWSFAVLVREVRANLVYRQFTRVGAAKVPDDKTLGRLARTLGPEIIEKIHQRLVALAQQNKVIRGFHTDSTGLQSLIVRSLLPERQGSRQAWPVGCCRR